MLFSEAIPFKAYLGLERIRSLRLNMKPEGPKSEQNKRIYLRIFLFALIGFALFFSGTWLRLVQIGAFNKTSNPYAGPPPLLTCLFVGGFGLVVGAVAGLFKKKR
jgi:hypothetical protein